MNKLDAISQRSKGMRILVYFAKTAIIGCGAGLLVLSIAKLNLPGGITLAMEKVDPEVALLQTEPTTPQEHSVQAEKSPLAAPISESDVLAYLEAVQAAETAQEEEPAVQTRPGAVKPDGWTGSAVTFDSDGNVLLYGMSVSGQSGMVLDHTTGRVGGKVSAREPVDDDFFSDTIVIGNSQVVGMQKSGVLNTRYYASIGLSVRQFFEKANMAVTDPQTGKTVYLTTAEALALNNDFKRVYLLFGINEMGWSIEKFIDEYEALIDTILAIRPDAEIYVQKILPMNEEVYTATTEEPQEYFTNARIDRFNASIEVMAVRKQVFVLDPGEVLRNEDGIIPADAVPSDGIHLTTPYISKWADYLKTHTADTTEA